MFACYFNKSNMPSKLCLNFKSVGGNSYGTDAHTRNKIDQISVFNSL